MHDSRYIVVLLSSFYFLLFSYKNSTGVSGSSLLLFFYFCCYQNYFAFFNTHFEERNAKYSVLCCFTFLISCHRSFINGKLRPKHKWVSIFYMHRKNRLVSKKFSQNSIYFGVIYFFICHFFYTTTFEQDILSVLNLHLCSFLMDFFKLN